MSDTILFQRSERIAQLVLNCPQQHNALGAEQLAALDGYLAEIEQDRELRVLILTGAGDKTFCAGASLKELSVGALADAGFQQVTARLSSQRIPTVCALNGNVFGGGAEVAASCDFRIGVEGMRMRVPAASLGLCYPLEGIHRFVECLGPAVARRVLVAAEPFDTAALVQIGFLDRVVPPAELMPEALAFSQHIAGLAPLAVQSMKRILRQMAAGSLDEGSAHEAMNRCLQSADLQEGLAAQREKRAAEFRGA